MRPENIQTLVVECSQQLGIGRLAIGLMNGDVPGFPLAGLELVAEGGDGKLQRLRLLGHPHGSVVAVEMIVAHLRGMYVERAAGRSRTAFKTEAALLISVEGQPFGAQQLAFALHLQQDTGTGFAAAQQHNGGLARGYTVLQGHEPVGRGKGHSGSVRIVEVEILGSTGGGIGPSSLGFDTVATGG